MVVMGWTEDYDYNFLVHMNMIHTSIAPINNEYNNTLTKFISFTESGEYIMANVNNPAKNTHNKYISIIIAKHT